MCVSWITERAHILVEINSHELSYFYGNTKFSPWQCYMACFDQKLNRTQKSNIISRPKKKNTNHYGILTAPAKPINYRFLPFHQSSTIWCGIYIHTWTVYYYSHYNLTLNKSENRAIPHGNIHNLKSIGFDKYKSK